MNCSHTHKQNGRRRRRQLNVLSARSVETQITRPSFRKPHSPRPAPRRRRRARGAGQNLLGDQAGVLADRRLDLRGHVGIGLEERLGVLAALAEPLAVIGEPGAGFLDDAGLDAEVEDFAHLGDALAIHDVELDLLERRRQLVLHHLDAGLCCRPPRRAP